MASKGFRANSITCWPLSGTPVGVDLSGLWRNRNGATNGHHRSLNRGWPIAGRQLGRELLLTHLAIATLRDEGHTQTSLEGEVVTLSVDADAFEDANFSDGSDTVGAHGGRSVLVQEGHLDMDEGHGVGEDDRVTHCWHELLGVGQGVRSYNASFDNGPHAGLGRDFTGGQVETLRWEGRGLLSGGLLAGGFGFVQGVGVAFSLQTPGFGLGGFSERGLTRGFGLGGFGDSLGLGGFGLGSFAGGLGLGGFEAGDLRLGRVRDVVRARFGRSDAGHHEHEHHEKDQDGRNSDAERNPILLDERRLGSSRGGEFFLGFLVDF